MTVEPTTEDPLLYAQCWEDAEVLRRALRIQPGDAVLSVASAGDNTLALLLDDPEHVFAIDRNPTQARVLQLKMAAVAKLPRDDTLELIGERPSHRRRELYESLRSALEPEVRDFWDRGQPQQWLAGGLIRAGKFERYLSLFRRRILPLIHSRRTIDKWFTLDNLEGQRRYYDEVWDNRRWRILFRIFFSKTVMKWKGRDPRFFSHVAQRNIGDEFRRRVERAFTELPVSSNGVLIWCLTGEHPENNLLPPYLRLENYETVANRIERIEVVLNSLETWCASREKSTLDAFNLSDVFEYMSESECESLFRHIAGASKPGARLCYWNLLVPRGHPSACNDLFAHDSNLSNLLHQQDQAFFYGRLIVETTCTP